MRPCIPCALVVHKHAQAMAMESMPLYRKFGICGSVLACLTTQNGSCLYAGGTCHQQRVHAMPMCLCQTALCSVVAIINTSMSNWPTRPDLLLAGTNVWAQEAQISTIKQQTPVQIHKGACDAMSAGIYSLPQQTFDAPLSNQSVIHITPVNEKVVYTHPLILPAKMLSLRQTSAVKPATRRAAQPPLRLAQIRPQAFPLMELAAEVGQVDAPIGVVIGG